MTATNLTYDASGNLTNEGTGGHTYTYNGKNQITRIDGSSTDNYLYDGEGRRTKKKVNGISTFYFYGPGGIISEFSTTTGASAASTSDTTCFQTSDRQGTAVLLIASSGLVIENNRTLPYGELWSPQVSSATTKTLSTYERDPESNLDYAMNRYTSNSYGRFQSPDSKLGHLARPISLNRYAYGIDDPVNRTDSTGNDPCVEGGTAFSITICGVSAPISPLTWFQLLRRRLNQVRRVFPRHPGSGKQRRLYPPSPAGICL